MHPCQIKYEFLKYKQGVAIIRTASAHSLNRPDLNIILKSTIFMNEAICVF